MTGSIQVKNDHYYAVLNFKDKATGKRKPRWFSSGLSVKGNNKRKIQQFLEDLKVQYAGQENLDLNSNIQFSEYLKNWLQDKKGTIELSTWESYDTYISRHLAPFFDKLQISLKDLKPQHIKDYYDYKLNGGRLDKKEGGLGTRSLKSHSLILKEVLNEAVVLELITRNPAEHISLPRIERNKEESRVFLSAEEANNLLEAFREHELQPLVYVTLYYGLRKSEVLGLKWDAVDFESDTIKIQHTIVKNKTIVAKDSTKTKASRRKLEMLPEIKVLLQDLKQKQEQNKDLFGNTYKNSNDYIFVRADGTQLRPDSVTRSFQRVLKKHGLKNMRFHDLRHSTASILYDKGWDIKEIQEWLGHADIETTSNIYTHISNSRKKAMAKNLENTFSL